MTEYWKKYIAWFDARKAREKAILGVAVIGSILMLGSDRWVWPTFAQSRSLSAETRQNTQTISEAKGQLVQLEKQVADPDAMARVTLEQLRNTLAQQEPQLRNIQASLVPADQMVQFLKSLLARSHSLQLLSLKTLPLVPADNPSTSVPSDTAAATASAATTGNAGLYKHGVEITISGSYADLVAYLSDLDKAPQKLIWGRMELRSDEYPRSVVTLTVYTLSLDKTWLVI